MKQLLKIFIFLGFFFSLFLNTFALEATLEVDKEKTNIDDSIILRIQIRSSNGGEIQITDIKGLENFEKIGQSQSQSSTTKAVVVNGKTKTKTVSIINLDLTLQAKQKGDFILGPVIIQTKSGSIKTNNVNIIVSGDHFFINSNHLNISKKSVVNNNQNNTISSNITKNEKIKTYNNIEKKDFKDKSSLYLFIGVLIIVLLGFYFVVKKNSKIIKSILKKEKKINQDNINNEKEDDFEEKTVEIKYPTIGEDNFLEEITEIFKERLKYKYKIKNIYSLTFEEISEITGEDKEIKKIVDLLNKAKYSNLIGNNSKILEVVKKY